LAVAAGNVQALRALCLALVLVGLGLVAWQWHEAEAARGVAQSLAAAEVDQRRRAEEALARAHEDMYALHLASAEREWLTGDAARAAALLDQCTPSLRRWE
jgi:hypothetical protein